MDNKNLKNFVIKKFSKKYKENNFKNLNIYKIKLIIQKLFFYHKKKEIFNKLFSYLYTCNKLKKN